jgi:alkanesulfonate monooxygenase SsuD/methylene tetrahydromethanopterin reductase-like flavin-dependent oxidoreductase (luciferase family)
MTNKAFRFGVVGTPYGGGESWRAQARRYAELGYGSLLMPDVLHLPAPFPSLAMAAAVADLRVGTWVAAAPLRPPRLAAWEAHSMTTLTGGRFEFGIGAGRPAMAQELADVGLPFGSAAERLALVAATIEAVHELDGDGTHTPIVMAAGGPKSRTFAAEQADIVTFATDAMTGRDQIRDLVADVRAKAGDRGDDIEFTTNLFVVGDEVPPQVARYLDVDAAAFLAADTMARLSGNVQDMADELRRRRDDLGASYVTVNAQFCEQLAPVVEMLAGT